MNIYFEIRNRFQKRRKLAGNNSNDMCNTSLSQSNVHNGMLRM